MYFNKRKRIEFSNFLSFFLCINEETISTCNFFLLVVLVSSPPLVNAQLAQQTWCMIYNTLSWFCIRSYWANFSRTFFFFHTEYFSIVCEHSNVFYIFKWLIEIKSRRLCCEICNVYEIKNFLYTAWMKTISIGFYLFLLYWLLLCYSWRYGYETIY